MNVTRFDDETRSRLILTFRGITQTPVGSTVEVKVDSTWYAATWTGSPTQQADGSYDQAAQTTGFFCGPTATPSGATVLASGRHQTETRVTFAGGDAVVSPSTVLDVTS
jgi:hypothetical protein